VWVGLSYMCSKDHPRGRGARYWYFPGTLRARLPRGHYIQPSTPKRKKRDVDEMGLAQALEKYNIEKDIAAYIKKEFDKKYNPTWHCIVGRNFGTPGV
jgi:hypothetical protein